MYRVVVNVSGRRARIIPEGNKLAVAERDFGVLSLEDAFANKNGIEDAVRELLKYKGVTNGDTFIVEVPDLLRTDVVELPEGAYEEVIGATSDKGPVTKPVNPKKGEQNSPENKPEDLEKQKADLKPKEEQSPLSDEDMKKGETKESEQQAT